MVRLKTRYILFEILYPCNELQTKELHDVTALNTEILLQHHRVSPPQITPKTIAQEVRHSLQVHFGDYGLGKAGSLLQIKYFSNRTSTGIIRCHREDTDLVVMALCLTSKIGDIDSIIVNPVKLSGTIKKVEQYTIRRAQRLLSTVHENSKDILDDFSNVSQGEDQDA
ncbi:POP5 (YAL033W) [Zygosaccharomyces parabailii]|nr:POP5 (YAL033W) [Zygosaccharomyces parabailii]